MKQLECPIKGCTNVGSSYDFITLKNRDQESRLDVCRECLRLPPHKVHPNIGVL